PVRTTTGPSPSVAALSPASSPRPGKSFDDGYAIWPQDTFRAAAEAPAEAWRDDPNAVAAQFASQVLGWNEARIKDPPLRSSDGECSGVRARIARCVEREPPRRTR